jgi:hypothetical protein
MKGTYNNEVRGNIVVACVYKRLIYARQSRLWHPLNEGRSDAKLQMNGYIIVFIHPVTLQEAIVIFLIVDLTRKTRIAD